MSSMLAPVVAMARHHLGGLVAVAFAVLGGSAMVTAGVIIGETGLTSHLPPERLAATEVLVSSPQSFHVAEDFDIPLPERVTVPAELAAEVAQVPGVAAAAGDLTFAVSLPGPEMLVEGHSWAVAALGDPELDGAAPQGPNELVLDAGTARAAGVAVGDRIEVAVHGQARTQVVSGVVDSPGAGVHFDEQTATALADRSDGQVDLVAVAVEPGADVDAVADAIEAAVGSGYVVSTGDARGDVETIESGAARGELIALAGSLAGTLLLLVGCIIAGALSVSVANQRRDLALLRAVGATPRQVRRIIATQASLVAAIALVPGIALGYLLAGALAGALADAGMMPDALPVARSPFPALIVAALSLLTVQVAARGAALRASRMPATEAVAESRVEPKEPSRVRTVIGSLLIVVALAPSLVPLFVRSETALASSVSSTLLAIVGLALAGPALVRAVTRRTAARLGARTPVAVWLAVKNSHAYALRTAGAVTVLALAIGLTLTQFYAQTTLDRATESELEAGLVADETLTGGVSADQVRDLADEPGIEAAVPLATTTFLHTHRFAGDPTTLAYPAFALGPGADQVVDLGVLRGDLAELVGETVAVSTATASSWSVDVGDTVDLVLANGAETRPTVVAVYERGFGFGGVIGSVDLLADFGGDRWFDMVLVDGDAATVTAWTAGHSGVEASPGSALLGDVQASPDKWIGMIILLAMLGYVLMAVANSLVASTGRRRAEFAELRLIGATRRQVLAMVTRESAVMSVLAIGAGLVVSVLPLTLLGLGIAGRPWPQGPLWVVPAVSAFVALIGYAATRTAAARAMRTG